MSKLDELKSSPDVGLAEYPADVCLSARLVAELEAADKVLLEREQIVTDLRAELDAAREVDEDAPKRPRRVGESPNADLVQHLKDAEDEADAAAQASDGIRERMEKATVRLTLRAKSGGAWRRWANAHPARDLDDDPAGARRDMRLAGGFCNIDDLVDDLGGYVEGEEPQPGFIAAYNGEPASDEWWEFVASNGAAAHLRDAAMRVVQMHEQVVDLGKSRLALLAERRSASSSV